MLLIVTISLFSNIILYNKYNIEKKRAINMENPDLGRFIHFSIDDCIEIYSNLDKNRETYNSIFENKLLKCLKSLNNEYGCKFSLFVYENNEKFDIANCTDKYKNEFEEARLEYNNNQTRDDRKIDDYFKKISNNSKSDLAVQIIIELGNKKFWDTKSMTYKHKMTNVFIKQVDDLELLLPNFKICSAIIHYDETSPHLHIVGVPIKYNCKTGMSMQVGKTDVFTRNSLKELQDKMRILCIEEYNKEYDLDATLKKKLKWVFW